MGDKKRQTGWEEIREEGNIRRANGREMRIYVAPIPRRKFADLRTRTL